MANYLGFQTVEEEEYFFISYNTENADVVSAICKSMSEQGVPLWYDYGIPYDSNWETVINGKIRNCKKVILFYTNDILHKPNSYVVKEYKAARFLEKEMLVVMLDKIDKKSVPDNQISFVLELMDKQTVQAYGSTTEKTSQEILRALAWDAPVAEKKITAEPDLDNEDEFIPRLRKGVQIINDYYEKQISYADGSGDRDSEYSHYKVGNILSFGRYPQGANGEIQPIEWQVLKRKAKSALVISKYCLDVKPFNTEYTDTTWAECSLRQWLNAEFIKNAFTEEERKAIETRTIITERNAEYGTDGGDPTRDKVFLLSAEEADEYFKTDEARMSKLTAYAKAKGAVDYEKLDFGVWWLRAPGFSQNIAAVVSSIGFVNTLGYPDSIDGIAVRAAMWIHLES